MLKKLLKQSAPILALIVLPYLASASGIQASPAKMEFKIPAGQTAGQELVVANPTADVQLFQVYPDEFENLISASPASFTLEAGARKSVRINIKADGSPNSETLNTNLSVIAKPLANAQFSANTGIKIPLAIAILPPSAQPADFKKYWPILLILAILIATAAGKKRKL